jgi:Reductase C-terminal
LVPASLGVVARNRRACGPQRSHFQGDGSCPNDFASNASDAAVPYDAVPWFWSDQGDRKLQIAGLAEPNDYTLVVQDDRDQSVETELGLFETGPQ